jgi:hypothetical protein
MMTIAAAVRMVVLPRSDNVWLTRWVFRAVNVIFRIATNKVNTYEERDRIMAYFAPVSLLSMPIVWLILVTIGYTGIFWGIGVRPLYDAFLLSGSSLLTLGFAPVDNLAEMLLAFSEATIGLILIALLIAYLPTMYSTFSRRETQVTLLEIRAGSPPSAITMLGRATRLGRLDQLGEVWARWEVWFAEVDESHTSLAPLVFFRSPRPEHSWITAAGAVLDAAALTASAVDIPRDMRTDLCIRAGYLALRHIADYFSSIEYNPNPAPDDPISISKYEFIEACEALAAEGVPLKKDLDRAWRDFAGWRVNYDVVLLRLAALTMAPYAPWVSDRSPIRLAGQKRAD